MRRKKKKEKGEKKDNMADRERERERALVSIPRPYISRKKYILSSIANDN